MMVGAIHYNTQRVYVLMGIGLWLGTPVPFFLEIWHRGAQCHEFCLFRQMCMVAYRRLKPGEQSASQLREGILNERDAQPLTPGPSPTRGEGGKANPYAPESPLLARRTRQFPADHFANASDLPKIGKVVVSCEISLWGNVT
jgi:hypothetical protein